MNGLNNTINNGNSKTEELDIRKLTTKPGTGNFSETRWLWLKVQNELHDIVCQDPICLFTLLDTLGTNMSNGLYFYDGMDIYRKYLMTRLFYKQDADEAKLIYGNRMKYTACAYHLFIKLMKMDSNTYLDKNQLTTIDNALQKAFVLFRLEAKTTSHIPLHTSALEEILANKLYKYLNISYLIISKDLNYLMENDVKLVDALKYDNYDAIELANNK